MLHQISTVESSVQLNRTTRSHQRIDEPFLFDICDPTGNQERSTTKMNGQFAHSQVLIDRLLEVSSSSTNKNELITFLKNSRQHLFQGKRDIFNNFEKKYSKKKAVWWYTRESPLYSCLNEALRTQNIDLLYMFRFFIRDLHNQLKQHQHQTCITVYRGQLMSNDEFQMLRNSKGKLISVNSFFSTTTKRRTAVFRLCLPPPTNDDLKRVLFKIDLDPSVVTRKSFANISSLSFFKDEDEFLIMLGSIFRLLHISPGKNLEKGAWIIEMKLSGDEDHDLKPVIDNIKADNGQSDDKQSLLLFAHALRDMGKFDDAKNYYNRLLDGLSKDDKKMASRCYHGLGNVMDDKGDHDKSIEFLRKALKTLMQTSEPDMERLARIYISLGAAYTNKDNLNRALISYRKALSKLKSPCDARMNYYLTAMCHFNMAEIFLKEKKHAKAFKWYKKAKNVCQTHLCREHPLLGSCYNGCGELHLSLGRSKTARKHFYHALKIYNRSLTPDHYDFADTIQNLGKTYEIEGHNKRARWFYEKAGNVFHHVLLPIHRKALENEENIRRVSTC